jgi:hypothetical protein
MLLFVTTIAFRCPILKFEVSMGREVVTGEVGD